MEINKCDWLFIGDSFTQGAQVDYRDLYTSLLYKYFPDKIIVNAGISGAGLYDELNYYKEEGKKLKPKLVFLQVGAFNDFMDVREHKATFQDYLVEWSSLYRFFKYNVNNSDDLPLGRWTEPFFKNREDNQTSNIFYKETCEYKENDKKAFAQCLRDFKKEVESQNGKLILLLIPSKEQVSPKLLKEVLTSYHISEDEIDLSIPGELCKITADKLNIKFVDMTNDFRFSNSFPFFAHDEHMNHIGHKLIADRLHNVLYTQSNKYEYLSDGNNHERYPTISDNSLLYQSQNEDYYLINTRDYSTKEVKNLWKGPQELIHPMFSQNKSMMIFTEGDQEHSQTDVILHNFTTNNSEKINKDGYYGAIPTFSDDSKFIAFPEWEKGKSYPQITIYNVINKKRISFKDKGECWRPIFSHNGDMVYYIEKESSKDKFKIKSYNIKTKKTAVILEMPYDIWDIAISPSGKYLAYSGNKNGNWDLFLYELSSKKSKQLTNSLGDEWDPSFGPNDNEIWFGGVFGINDGIYKMTIK